MALHAVHHGHATLVPRRVDKQLACIENDSRIPIYEATEPKSTDHPVNPKWSDKSNNCKRCYRSHKKVQRTMVICVT